MAGRSVMGRLAWREASGTELRDTSTGEKAL